MMNETVPANKIGKPMRNRVIVNGWHKPNNPKAISKIAARSSQRFNSGTSVKNPQPIPLGEG